MLQIDSDVPVPPISRGGSPGAKPKYPFDLMEVGDSFAAYPEHSSLVQLRNSVRHCMYKKAVLGRKFIVRTIDNGIRVWRVA
jgi:hypothetical protein